MRTTQKLRRFSLLFVAFFMALTFLISAVPQTAYAAQKNPADQLERWLYYRGMRACLDSPDFNLGNPISDNGSAKSSDINKGHFIGGIKKGFGYLGPSLDGADITKGDDNDGTVECSDGSIWVRGSQLFGFSSVVELICAMNRGMTALGDGGRITPSDPLDCEQSERFEFDGGTDKFQKALTWALENEGDKDRPNFHINDNKGPDYPHGALLYLIGKKSLEIFCGNGRSLESTVANRTTDQIEASKKLVSVRVVIDGKISEKHAYPIANPERDENSLVDDVYYDQGGNHNNAKDLRCHEMAQMTRDNVDAYLAWAVKNPEEAEKNAKSGTDASGSDENTCESNGGLLSWALCPILDGLDKVLGWLDDSISRLLFVESDIYNSPEIKASWAVIRNIAFLILVPMMLLMVIGTALEFGPFDAYTVKKALPRMFVAVIFIALSLPITQFGVQASNIIGNGMGNLITSAVPEDQRVDSLSEVLVGTDSTAGNTARAAGFMALMTGGVAAGIGGALAGGGVIFVLLSFAFVAFLALLTGFAILVLRQVLILLLLVIAPLAILVWIFPGNDKLWAVWKTTFIAMLMMYPLISILIASGKFVAGIANF